MLSLRVNSPQLLPITGEMSLDATLARIAHLDAVFASPSQILSGATQNTATTSVSTQPATTGTTSFASQLQGAIAPQMSTMQGALAPEVSTAQGTSPASQIVRIAESQVGATEQPPGSNDSPQIAMYRTATQGAIAGAPWCAYFASWVAQRAGEPLGGSGQGLGYVGDIWNWAQQTGRAIPNGPGVVPQPGDLIVFGDHHVGIVDQVLPNGDIQTIEGNYNNQVSRVTRQPGEATGYVQM